MKEWCVNIKNTNKIKQGNIINYFDIKCKGDILWENLENEDDFILIERYKNFYENLKMEWYDMKKKEIKKAIIYIDLITLLQNLLLELELYNNSNNE